MSVDKSDLNAFCVWHGPYFTTGEQRCPQCAPAAHPAAHQESATQFDTRRPSAEYLHEVADPEQPSAALADRLEELADVLAAHTSVAYSYISDLLIAARALRSRR